MPPPKPPSRVDNIPFPVFGCTWFGVPALPPKNTGCSVLAYCGGGGSAKTGVNNKINLAVTVTAPPPASDGEPGGGEVGSSITTKYNVNIGTKEQVCVGVHLFDGGQALGGGVYLLAAVGDEVRLYTVPLQAPPEPTLSPEDETKILKQKDDTDKPPPGLEYLLGSIHVGDKYGSNAVSFNPVDSTVVVGCENGHVVLFQMEKNVRWCNLSPNCRHGRAC
mmetsp:Transcript_13584/g.18641  ORF Transcript_13584/g.18641 Transcript_13584/m.18641 type:complete len:220 (-) Transcript_13584:1185-1844(-)